MTLSTKLHVGFAAKQTNPLDLGSADANLAREYAVSLADGALAGQANRIWSDTRPLAASATEDLDLAGPLLDAFGVAVSFARVKALIIAASKGNTNNLVIGGAASNGFISWVGGAAHTLILRPGAVLALLAGVEDATGYVVTATTGDQLRIGNSGGGSAVSYDIAIIGAAS